MTTNLLFFLFEDENKSCFRWCYPPSSAKNLTLRERRDRSRVRVSLPCVSRVSFRVT